MAEHVSIAAKRRVEDAIERKVAVLRRWSRSIPWKTNDDGQPVRDGKGELVLEYFPTSIDAFCDWNGSQNSNFSRAREDLYFNGPSKAAINSTPHDASRRSVRDMLDTLKARASHQLLRANKANVISRLLGERSWQRKLIRQQESEIAVLLDEVMMKTEELESERTTRRSNEEQLLARVEQLEKRNAELSKLVRKVTPLQSS